MPMGAHILWPGNAGVAVDVRNVHAEVRYGLRAVHQHQRPPRVSHFRMAFTSFTVPRTLETWVTATMRTLSVHSFSAPSRSSVPCG